MHPHIELVRVCAADHVGEPIASALPHLEGMTGPGFRKSSRGRGDRRRQRCAHGPTARSEHRDRRSTDAERCAGHRHVRSVPTARCGRVSPILRRRPHATRAPRSLHVRLARAPPRAIREARFVASPGCFATSIELALLPFARAGLLRGNVEVVGITGSSGAGVTPSPTTHHPTRSVNLRTYRPLNHQHAPEIEAVLRTAGARDLRVNFVPVSAPLARGIFATAFFRVPSSVSAERLVELLATPTRPNLSCARRAIACPRSSPSPARTTRKSASLPLPKRATPGSSPRLPRSTISSRAARARPFEDEFDVRIARDDRAGKFRADTRSSQNDHERLRESRPDPRVPKSRRSSSKCANTRSRSATAATTP